MNKAPFFIIGCVRSGTTLLRNILRKHPNLASPEESHFYRWGDPFNTDMYKVPILRNPDLQRHRALDGVSQDEFVEVLQSSVSKADLYHRYMVLYLEKSGQQGKRWFDKTPQNVNGAALIASQFPDSQFLHIVRNPVDVVSSLRIGKVLKIEDLVGACNYWTESVQVIDVLKRAYPERVYEVRYEDFTSHLEQSIKELLIFIGEPWSAAYFSEFTTQPSKHRYEDLFSANEREIIRQLCGAWGEKYGYYHDGITS